MPRYFYLITTFIFGTCLFFGSRKGASAILINPQSSGAESKTFTHCLDNGDPLQMADPFDSRELDKNTFVLMEWVKVVGRVEKSVIFIKPNGESTIVDEFKDKVSIFQTWGIQISPVSLDDVAKYRATLLRKTNPEERNLTITVVIARAPKLASEKLTITSQGGGQEQVLLCGQVASLGQPPGNLIWKDQDGKILNSTFDNGFLKLELNTTSDSGEFVCEIEDSSPAKACIPPTERDLWDTSYNLGQSTQGADTTVMIIGVVGVILCVLIIIVIIFCIISRRRKVAYNTKKGEKRKIEEVTIPLNSDNNGFEDSAPRLPSKVKDTSPYHVSNINPANSESSHYASSPINKPTTPPQTAPKPAQRQQIQEKETSDGNGKTPKPKPRSRGSIGDLTLLEPESSAINSGTSV